MTRRVRLQPAGPLLVALVALVALLTLLSAQPPGARPAASPALTRTALLAPLATRSADDPIDRVVAISIDGLNPRAITTLGARRTPTFHRLMRQGAFTLNARTAREQTRTLPNHTGMLTGRRISARHGGHGVTYNADASGRTVHRSAGEYVSSVFDVVHDRGGRTALFSTKTKFALYARTWNANGAPDRIGRDDGRAKIDTFVVDTNATRLVAKATSYLRSRPGQFVFLHVALPDEAGHASGFMGKQYLAAVQRTDRLVGSVLATISAQPALRADTLVLVTADHGGKGASHSSAKRLQNYRVPLFAWGPGVAAGKDLYRLNPSRRDPGKHRTSYKGRQPIRNGDVANLVTDVLDLPRVPGAQFDADRKLTVFAR